MDMLFFCVVIKRVFVQILEVKKLRQRHIKGNGDFVHRFDAGIFGDPADDIVQCRLPNVAHRGQLVDRDATLSA